MFDRRSERPFFGPGPRPRPRRPQPPVTRRRGLGLSPQNKYLPGQSHKYSQIQGTANHVKTMFQDEKGEWDYGKLMTTAGQLQDVYQNVSPLISGVMKKLK
ncbi:hypothetical protein [Oceanobacillus iheyensis HTE831]|uniref:YppG-like protein n=1 Tax=Oceanobacillus iheyensis (strain DSM 14371 / CIP 107618 / JCM 11309 / KCTC 3954 / HTE831) TaxID=221109 RepID=Q8EMZ5_OCEIH|nr:YppG family protein [Oceanobacillus iheyensis]BAC14651.1 hypothetical protein [Oceanobacillus iheyensis HTE831]